MEIKLQSAKHHQQVHDWRKEWKRRRKIKSTVKKGRETHDFSLYTLCVTQCGVDDVFEI